MKRMICLLLALCLVAALAACSADGSPLGGSVRFYYPKSEISYDDPDGVIGVEMQENLDPGDDLKYLLAHYLSGPTSREFYSPFPAELRLTSIETRGNALLLTFNSHLLDIKGYEMSKACACVAMTCLGLTDVASVTIFASEPTWGAKKIFRITRDNLHFSDLVSDPDNGGTE